MTVQEIIQTALEVRVQQRDEEIAERREKLEVERKKYEALIDEFDLNLVTEALTVYTTTADENPNDPPQDWYTRLRVPTKTGDGTLGYLRVHPYGSRALHMTAEGTSSIPGWRAGDRMATVSNQREFMAFLGESYNVFEVKAAVEKSKP